MSIPVDPQLAAQWHLRNPRAGLLDLNLVRAWDPAEGPGYSGAGVRAVVIDDGFDRLHPDLAPNYLASLDRDYERGGADALGSASDPHGTAVMGLLGAAADGAGVVGVAHGARLVGYRVSPYVNDAGAATIRDAIRDAALVAGGDLANLSLSFANDPGTKFGAGLDPALLAGIGTSIGTAVAQGRGGLGMTLVKAAGNGRADTYDVNADDWGNDTRQVIVAAIDQDGGVSSYSSYGAALLVSAFGSTGDILTTDRRGDAGYVAGSQNPGFNGTSAAAPMVAGVVALIYEAAPELGWRDVQSILAASARRVGSEFGDGPRGDEMHEWGWNAARGWNGGGMHFSNDYGYGLVDARAAVRLAESWRLTGTAAATNANQTLTRLDVLDAPVTLPDGDGRSRAFTGVATRDVTVERATVQLRFDAGYVGDLEVFLTSPGGTESKLLTHLTGAAAYSGSWTFETQAFRGESGAGAWTVRLADTARFDEVRVTDVVIRTFGAATAHDRHVFTNAFSDHAGAAGRRTAIADTNGGVDTVNAAAVTTRSTLRLDGGDGSIDGVAVTFAGMENAIGGEAGDTIIGNSAANGLHGMRGPDTINAGGGNDLVYGGTGNDLLNGGAGADRVEGGAGADRIIDEDGLNGDVLVGGAGVDTIDYSRVSFAAGTVTLDLATGRAATAAGAARDTIAGFENARGSQGSETIRGTAGANTLLGNGGDDRLIGEAGADVLTGGLGRDQLYGGAGADRFVFAARAESPAGAGADVLKGYSSGPAFDGPGAAAGDVIDLSLIDADETRPGDQAFRFDASQAPGTLRVAEAGGLSRVLGYIDARAGADLQIDIEDGAVLAAQYRAADFIL